MISAAAIISKSANIGKNVEISDFAKIGENVKILEGAKIGHGAVIDKNTTVGKGTKISPYAVIGTDPQDLKYKGEESFCEIGNNCIIREFVTVNRGTAASGKTVVGDGTLLMAYVHVAHDCRVGKKCILANCAGLAGHVIVEDNAVIGGYTPVHQFVRIGTFSILGGDSRITQDVPPYSMAVGNPAYLYGLNLVGLKRAGFSPGKILLLKKAYRTLFKSSLKKEEAIKSALKLGKIPELKKLINFVKTSGRGIVPSK